MAQFQVQDGPLVEEVGSDELQLQGGPLVNETNGGTTTRQVVIDLLTRGNIAPGALTDVHYAWWEETDVAVIGAPDGQGSNGVINTSGTIVLPLVDTTLLAGDDVLVWLYSSDKTKRFAGIWTVS